MTDTHLPLDADVTVIRTLPAEDPERRIPIHSLVITGSEPVLVDCGSSASGDEWWAQVEAVVDPPDVRWVFVSHDDVDHTGNLSQVLERCPDATVVSSWLIDQRQGVDGPIPRERSRWLNDGETFDAGERRLVALRPPVYDAPSTRGLYDVTSGVYWSVDCFGMVVPYAADEVSELDRDVWEDALGAFPQLIAPWIAEVDPLRWRAAIGRVAGLDPKVIASAHGPVIRRRDIERALDVLAEVPRLPIAAPPGQRELEAILASTNTS